MEKIEMIDFSGFIAPEVHDTRPAKLRVAHDEMRKVRNIEWSTSRPVIILRFEKGSVNLVDTPDTIEFLKKYFIMD